MMCIIETITAEKHLPPSPERDDKGDDKYENEVHIGKEVEEPYVEWPDRLIS